MKKTEFERADGSKGVKYTLEAGDKVKSRYDQPRENNKGKYPSYSLGVTHEEEGEIYVQLTKNQHDQLMKSTPLNDKTIEAYEYENQHGKFIGVKTL